MTDGHRFVLPDWGPDHLTLDAVVAYVDDELDAGARGRAEGHLVACPQCGAEVVAQRQARAALRAAAGPRLPSSLLHTLRAIPVEAELPAPPPGLGVTADGQFVLLRDVPRADGPATDRGPSGPAGGARRPSRWVRFGAVSGLAIGALAVGALTAPGPAAPPGPGVLGGAVLNAPGSNAPVSGEVAARLGVDPAPARAAVPAGDALPDGDAASPAESDAPSSAPSSSSAAPSPDDGARVLDAALRQRLDRTPAAFHRP